MTRMHSSRGRKECLAAALLVFAIALLPGSAAAMRGSDNLSPRLAKLAGTSLGAASPVTQARALGLSSGGLARDGRRLLVNVRFDGGALAARGELREAGAQVVAPSGRYQTVTIAVAPARLRAISRVRGVEGITPVFAPVAAEAACPSGAIVSEGDVQLNAEAAREASPEPDGTGVTVGILSDSFDQATEAGDGSGEIATHAEEDVESGDLPGANACENKATVQEVGEKDQESRPSDEGRAMAQIVHDLAPGAELKFASAFNGDISFANNIRALAAEGADVIVDDVFYPDEPFFQDGPIAVAVREVVEDGVTYFSAAGNNNLLDPEGHDIASWETPEYRDAGGCPVGVRAIAGANAFHCLDFNPDPGAVDRTFGIKVKPGATLALDLQWDEPWNGVDSDLDAYLLDSTGARIPGAESRELNVEVSHTPVEVIKWPNSSSSTRTVQLVVNRSVDSGEDPRVKFALIQNGGGVAATEYPRSSGEDVVGPTLFGHSGSAAAISIGAVFFADSSELETYSSRGPVRHDFEPVEGPAPAPAVATETLSKPDLVATDCGKTTFFSFLFAGFWRFCGTSAAAPHAAAVAALMLEAKPAADPEDVRAALVAGAAEVGEVGKYDSCAVGAGLVEAVGAIEEVLAQTGASGPVCEPPESEVEPDEAAAPGYWGSEVPPVPPSEPPKTTPPPPQEEEKEPEPAIAPRTFFLQRPAKVIRTLTRGARAVFLFGSNEADASFVCRIDGGLFRPCPARLARRFRLGWHTVKVSARDASGNGDKTPARYRFKVKRVR